MGNFDWPLQSEPLKFATFPQTHSVLLGLIPLYMLFSKLEAPFADFALYPFYCNSQGSGDSYTLSTEFY